MNSQYQNPVKILAGDSAADHIPGELHMEDKSRPLLIAEGKPGEKKRLRSLFTASGMEPAAMLILNKELKDPFEGSNPVELITALKCDTLICCCGTRLFSRIMDRLESVEAELPTPVTVTWIITGAGNPEGTSQLINRYEEELAEGYKGRILYNLAVLDSRFISLSSARRVSALDQTLHLTRQVLSWNGAHPASRALAETAVLSAAESYRRGGKKRDLLTVQAHFYAISAVISCDIKEDPSDLTSPGLRKRALKQQILDSAKPLAPWGELKKNRFPLMNRPGFYEFAGRVKTVSGPGALELIPDELIRLGAKRPMILCTPSIYKRDLCNIFLDQFPSGMEAGAIETDIPQDSDLKRVKELAEIYRKNDCDSIIAVGGGTFLDTAKGVNILVSENSDNLEEFTGSYTVRRKLKPLVTVPTTSGTGSEATVVSVIADQENKKKLLFLSWYLLPDLAVLDPRMTLTLPAGLTASTGMDALTHAVEAYYGLAKNPGSDRLAWNAVRKIYNHLETAVRTPENAEARLELATASNMAGTAFSNSMVGMIHTIGHAVGAETHIPHGNCMAILLPYGLEYNLHKSASKYCELLYAIEPEAQFETEEEGGLRFIEKIRDLNRRLCEATGGAFTDHFSNYCDRDGNTVMKLEQIPAIAEKSLNDASVFYNPEQLSFEESVIVLEAAWNGQPLNRDRIRKGHQR